MTVFLNIQRFLIQRSEQKRREVDKSKKAHLSTFATFPLQDVDRVNHIHGIGLERIERHQIFSRKC